MYTYITICYDSKKVIDYLHHHKLVYSTHKKYSLPIKVNYNIIGFVSY